jgi:hypothetical protein
MMRLSVSMMRLSVSMMRLNGGVMLAKSRACEPLAGQAYAPQAVSAS